MFIGFPGEFLENATAENGPFKKERKPERRRFRNAGILGFRERDLAVPAREVQRGVPVPPARKLSRRSELHRFPNVRI